MGSLTVPTCLGGYYDVNAPDRRYDVVNVPVTVLDEKGEIIGTSSTAADAKTRAMLDDKRRQIETHDPPTCVVAFQVMVPKAKYYQIKVGTHTGAPYSFDDLRSHNFVVQLSLN